MATYLADKVVVYEGTPVRFLVLTVAVPMAVPRAITSTITTEDGGRAAKRTSALPCEEDVATSRIALPDCHH